MTALIAPVRATSFEGLIFFVYDREAVTKEADPPESAIVYFYPPSASIEDRISICGQLIGMSHFIRGFIGSKPALCKLQTEKVATVHSGRYTLALGGSLGEPDSLLIRQLQTLHSLFTFYHGSLDRIRTMCRSQKQFLSWMNVIWDCYLHFVRHYGDFLPGVFDPLPFLDLPKRVAATCFTKASYILQSCQRRKHILGGCILYSNSILCTQLEPSITERLILLKPNQSNLPARPVKTGCDLPFGVRILNAFLTLSEYLNLYDALAESAYRQPDSAESTGAFPDMYPSSESQRNSSGGVSDDKHVSSDVGANLSEGRRSTERGGDSTGNSVGNVASGIPSDMADGAMLQGEKERKDSKAVSEKELRLKDGVEISSEVERGVEGVRTSVEVNKRAKKQNEREAAEERTGEEQSEREACVRIGEKRRSEKQNKSNGSSILIADKKTGKERNEREASALSVNKRIEHEQTESEASVLIAEKNTEDVLDKSGREGVDDVDAATCSSDSSSCESTSFTNASLTMESIDLTGSTVVSNSSTVFDSSSCESVLSSSFGLTMEAIDVTGLKVVKCSGSSEERSCDGEEKEKKKCSHCSSSNGSSFGTASENEDTQPCGLVLDELINKVCKMIENETSFSHSEQVESATASRACCQECADTHKSRDFRCIDTKKASDISSKGKNVCETRENAHEAGSNGTSTETAPTCVDQDLEEETANCMPDIEEQKFWASDRKDGERTSCSIKPEAPDSSENSLRSELIKTPIVCDSFSVRNLNSRSPEKFLEKSFSCIDAGILESERKDSTSVNSTPSCSSDLDDGTPVAELEIRENEGHNSEVVNLNDTYNSEGEDRVPVATLGRPETESNVSGNVNLNAPYSSEVDGGVPVAISGIQEAERNASRSSNSITACSTAMEGGRPDNTSLVSIDSEIHVTDGLERTYSGEGSEASVDTALEEMEDGSPHEQWCELPLPSQPDLEEEEELLFEEEGDELNQVEGLTHVNLYVQAHSKIVLILLAEEGLNNDCNSIKALWETSLNQLGELEFLVKQSCGDKPATLYSDEYSFLVYDSFERTMKGNLDELVHQADHLFCETTKVLHEQFENCSSLKDVMLRNRSSTLYGKRNLGRGTYFHLKGPYRIPQGVPSHRDPFLKLEERASKVLNKDHGVNVF